MPDIVPPRTEDSGLVGRIKVALRISGDAVDPASITRLLHTEPTFAAKKGEEVWLSRFPSDATMWTELAASHEIGIFCGLYLTTDNQGTDLRPSTLQALADRRLSLSLDIYGATQ